MLPMVKTGQEFTQKQIDVTVLVEKKNFTFDIDALIRTDGLCMSN